VSTTGTAKATLYFTAPNVAFPLKGEGGVRDLQHDRGRRIRKSEEVVEKKRETVVARGVGSTLVVRGNCV